MALSRKKINKLIGRVLFAVFLSGMFVLLISAVRSKEEKTCAGVDIQIGKTDQKGFIDDKEIARVIGNEVGAKIVTTPIKQFDLNKTESVLEENVWIKKAQLFFDNNEVLHVAVEQRIPVARIMDVYGASYYLDSVGYQLPLSNTDRANVPVFTNVPVKQSAALKARIIDMATYITADSFWLAQAAQINVLPGSKFEMYPAFGHHVVDLGDGKNPANKFGRLKLFYKTVSAKEGFDVYPKLSVAYDGQVLAIKGFAASRVDSISAMKAFERMVRDNRHTANDEKIQETIKQKTLSKASAGDNGERGKPVEIKSKNKEAGDDYEKKPKAVMPKKTDN